ncbi:hypothetical protein [Streptomyces aidingensis]|uniref:hypothetical protein n=1 Tax=Streptomyces aidingensis TaxID=910347 RepID=UPI0015875075|nr:hypothetical protein [Streptomyces aidingensis]
MNERRTQPEAAAATFTGRMNAKFGLTDVNVTRADGPPGQHTNAEVIFSRGS